MTLGTLHHVNRTELHVAGALEKREVKGIYNTEKNKNSEFYSYTFFFFWLSGLHLLFFVFLSRFFFFLHKYTSLRFFFFFFFFFWEGGFKSCGFIQYHAKSLRDKFVWESA